MHNRHKPLDHCLPQCVARVMKIKFPATLMVFGVVSSEGNVILRGRAEGTHQHLPTSYGLDHPGDQWTSLGVEANTTSCSACKKYLAWLKENYYDLVTKDQLTPPPHQPRS
uniref:Uncharacterized protein n=1 Tax=Lepeophtheirus salmonis TaxID=72036 RepID=A0A0K2SYJ2_LEPSM